MGKKKKTSQTTTTTSTTTPVSIVTITQLKRYESLEILCELIKTQTYKHIIEWVIVEGSKEREDALKNKENIELLKKSIDIPIIYIEWNGYKLGELRNQGNNACKGDITVCMDDDDFYFPTRVQYAVEKLKASKFLIAGCSNILLYDFFLEKLYKFKNFGIYHSTNNCMAWKKEYLLKNRHDSDKEFAEETSFTNTFTEPMVQLETEHTLIVSSHNMNTYNKREILVGGTNKFNPTLDEVNEPITKYISKNIFDRMRSLYYKECESKYDITYLAGGFSIKWDPSDMSLGGSEQAIVNLVNNWAKMGKRVVVYGEVPEMRLNGVDYVNWKNFPFEAKHNVVILWRLYGLMCFMPFPLKCKKILLDCHDNFHNAQFVELYKKYSTKIDKIMFKSEYHKEEFERYTEIKLPLNKYEIVLNGVRIENFLINKDNVIRNPYRFVYCSCYMRGLIEILQIVWPIIFQNEPRAELHIYYGMGNIRDENAVKLLKELLSQPGVMDHGRQPMDIVIREKYMSNFHLYLSTSPIEIDCISIRESLATGAIPLISNFGVFKNREGIHFDIVPDVRCYQEIAIKILQLMKESNTLETYRTHIKKSSLLVGWRDISIKWLEIIN